MDILKIIKSQAHLFTEDDTSGMNAVIAHLDRAADLLEDGKEENDSQYFNDVIYRTNQAYEGILKEGYQIISGMDAGRMRLYDIENYFKDQHILSGRVLYLFENYRRQWRNPSTHDYQLFFSVNEAFLAIVSVVAFTHALLDRMIEADTISRHIQPTSRSLEGTSLTTPQLLGKLAELSDAFIQESSLMQFSKPEILGRLFAHWMNNGLGVTPKREEVVIEDGLERYYDFYVQNTGEQGILVELIIKPNAAVLENFKQIMQKDIATNAYAGGLLIIVGEASRIYALN